MFEKCWINSILKDIFRAFNKCISIMPPVTWKYWKQCCTIQLVVWFFAYTSNISKSDFSSILEIRYNIFFISQFSANFNFHFDSFFLLALWVERKLVNYCKCSLCVLEKIHSLIIVYCVPLIPIRTSVKVEVFYLLAFLFIYLSYLLKAMLIFNRFIGNVTL